MKIDDMLVEIAKESWMFESWSNHEADGSATYSIKLSCGVQARGRKTFTNSVFELALTEAHLYAVNWRHN